VLDYSSHGRFRHNVEPIKVLFISPSFYPATYYGGPIFINRSYCDSLAGHESVRLQVLTTDADGPGKRIDFGRAGMITPRYAIEFCRRMFPPDVAPGLMLRLPGLIRRADIVHLNGVYSFTTIPTLALSRLMGKPVVWSTLGALQSWEGTTRPKSKALWEKICDLICKPEGVLLHVTSEEEETESLGKLRHASAMLLRNGIEMPELGDARSSDRDDILRLLYIGRLHPIKGIENLLRALTMVKRNYRLSICGEGNTVYESYLRSQVAELKLTSRVQFRGRVDGEIKEQQFREADLCIAPSFKEAFCTVVLESLARGVPVIAGRGTPWQRVEEHGCGLWVENDPHELASAIDRAASMPLAEMGRRGREWMERDFSWPQVASEMLDQYRILIQGDRRKQTEVATFPKTA